METQKSNKFIIINSFLIIGGSMILMGATSLIDGFLGTTTMDGNILSPASSGNFGLLLGFLQSVPLFFSFFILVNIRPVNLYILTLYIILFNLGGNYLIRLLNESATPLNLGQVFIVLFTASLIINLFLFRDDLIKKIFSNEK